MSIEKNAHKAPDFAGYTGNHETYKRGRPDDAGCPTWVSLSVSLIFTLAILFLAVSAHAAVPTQEQPIAVIRALDKMTARVEEIELPVGKEFSFGKLSITAHNCRTTLPEETPPESAAYLEISEAKPGLVTGSQYVPVFNGWMFASSPALSAMEHPTYDVWVTGCRDKSGKLVSN